MDPDMEVINRYGVEPKLTSLYAKGGHAMICLCEDPAWVAKVEIQQGPGKLALLRKEQEFMRDFKGVPGLAYSGDVYWNIPHPYLKDHVYNVMYTPFYPFALEEMKCSLLDIAVQLKAALNALHARGLVHRDVNPGNIRGITATRLVLIDFGLCAIESRLVQPKGKYVATGTPPFISESVMQGNVYTKRDDMVSACKVIHYLYDRENWLTQECPKDIVNLFFGDSVQVFDPMTC
jgi:hypothetical protein